MKWGSQSRANNFQGLLRIKVMASNGDDLDMELVNVSSAQGSSSLRYSFSHSMSIDSQCNLEVALATTNLEEPTPSAKPNL
jgi:hypothetical protein